MAAVLLLWAGSAVVFQLYREAATAEAHAAFRAAGTLYELPSALLFAFIADELFLPKPRTRRRLVLLGALVAYTAVLGILLASYPWLEDSRGLAEFFGQGRTQWGYEGRFGPVASLLPNLSGAGVFLAEAAVVATAARAAAAAPARSLQRQRALLVMVSFGFLAGHAGGFTLGSAMTRALLDGTLGVELVPAQVALAGNLAMAGAVAYALGRTWSTRAAPAGRRAIALLALPVAAGLFDGTVRLAPVPGLSQVYQTSRVVWVAAFAVGLAVAILRYDLAGAGTRAGARRARVTGALLLLGTAGLVAGALVSVLGTSWPSLALAAAVVVSPAALTLPPARAARRGLAALLTVDPRDPEVDRERARVYAAALRAAEARSGVRPDPGDPELHGLRLRLGLGDRDHELLASALDTRAEALAPGRFLLGRYRILRELGRGGFGEAFLAHDEVERREVVLKRLLGERARDAGALRRFHRELRLASTVQHPNIVAVHGTEAGPDGAYLVMEYLAGGSLADRLRDRGPLPEAEAAAMARDVLAGLAALHARGIVHRDVKPGNILFTAAGRAKVGDFTLAREVVSGETEGAGGPVPLGTLAYLAPEQVRGLPATPRSDLYSLGVTVYEALGGKPAVDLEGLTEYEAVLRVAQARPDLPLPAASAGMNAWLARALAKDPARRPADAERMAARLSRAGTPAGSAPRRRRPRARATPDRGPPAAN